jgi:hypothetical protein
METNNNVSNQMTNNVNLNFASMNGSLGTNDVSTLSKTEKVEQICKIFQQLIDLESSRPTNPFKENIDEKYTYFHHRNGSVTTEIETTRTYEYDDSVDKQVEKLNSQLEQLDVYNFMGSLTDDVASLTRISNLCFQWSNMVQSSVSQIDNLTKDLV